MNTILSENNVNIKGHKPWNLLKKKNIVTFDVILDGIDFKHQTSRSKVYICLVKY
jgi:hypothetical protein